MSLRTNSLGWCQRLDVLLGGWRAIYFWHHYSSPSSPRISLFRMQFCVYKQSINGDNIVCEYVYLLVFLERPVGDGYAQKFRVFMNIWSDCLIHHLWHGHVPCIRIVLEDGMAFVRHLNLDLFHLNLVRNGSSYVVSIDSPLAVSTDTNFYCCMPATFCS